MSGVICNTGVFYEFNKRWENVLPVASLSWGWDEGIVLGQGAVSMLFMCRQKIQESETDVIIISAVPIQWLSDCSPIHPVLWLVIHYRFCFRRDFTKHLKLNHNLQTWNSLKLPVFIVYCMYFFSYIFICHMQQTLDVLENIGVNIGK